MAGTITLQGPPKSTVPEDVDTINRAFDLIGQREKIRQDRQQINDFVAETIRIQGENKGLTKDEVFQLASERIISKGPQFSGGLAGVGQKFSSKFMGGPSTALSGPLAERAFDEPTGIRRDAITAQIEANQALTEQRKAGTAAGTIKATPGQKQRDADIKIINDEKATPGAIEEAKARLLQSADLFAPTLSVEDNDEDFRALLKDKAVKGLKIDVAGAKFDNQFGEEAFNKALELAKEKALKVGVSPDAVEQQFGEWWDAEAAKENPKGFGRLVQPRSEFKGEIQTLPAETDNLGTPQILPDTDLSPAIIQALKAGSINQQEFDSAKKILGQDPNKQADVLKALGL